MSHQASVWVGNGAHVCVMTFANLKPGEVLPDRPNIFYSTQSNHQKCPPLNVCSRNRADATALEFKLDWLNITHPVQALSPSRQ